MSEAIMPLIVLVILMIGSWMLTHWFETLFPGNPDDHDELL